MLLFSTKWIVSYFCENCNYFLQFFSWSGRWESNPRIQLGRLVFYHWTTPADHYNLLFMCCLTQSGWQDSNLRLPGPKPGALAKLSHTPDVLKSLVPALFSFQPLSNNASIIIKHTSVFVNTFCKTFFIFFFCSFLPVFPRKIRADLSEGYWHPSEKSCNSPNLPPILLPIKNRKIQIISYR